MEKNKILRKHAFHKPYFQNEVGPADVTCEQVRNAASEPHLSKAPGYLPTIRPEEICCTVQWSPNQLPLRTSGRKKAEDVSIFQPK